MKFDPKTEDELARESLLPDGIYPFEVLLAADEFSKAGNEMIKLKLNVFGPDGEQVHVFDHLLEKLAYKLRHFAETTGLLADYERGELTAFSCIGKTGYAKIVIDPAKNGYASKNAVKDYIARDKVAAKTMPPWWTPEGNASATPTTPTVRGEPVNFADKKAAATMAAQAPVAAGDFNDDIPF